jgi:hypothetical protein
MGRRCFACSNMVDFFRQDEQDEQVWSVFVCILFILRRTFFGQDEQDCDASP